MNFRQYVLQEEVETLKEVSMEDLRRGIESSNLKMVISSIRSALDRKKGFVNLTDTMNSSKSKIIDLKSSGVDLADEKQREEKIGELAQEIMKFVKTKKPVEEAPSVMPGWVKFGNTET